MTRQKLTPALWLALAYWLFIGAPLPSGLPDIGGTPPPFVSDTLRVLVVRESHDPLPLAQAEAIQGPTLPTLIPKGHWRVNDPNDDVSGDEAWVQDAFKAKHGNPPYIVLANKKKGFSGPLPPDATKLAELLKKYGD